MKQTKIQTKNLSLYYGAKMALNSISMDIPEKEVTLIFINGRHGGLESELHDGDTLGMFPPVGGG